MSKAEYDRQVELLLRFYGIMNKQDYEWVVDEYLGKHPDENGIVHNVLYLGVQAAIASMNLAHRKKDNE